MSELTQDRITVFIPDVRESEVVQEVSNIAEAQPAQIAAALATELTISVDPSNSALEGDADGDYVINIEQGESVPISKTSVEMIARAIKAVGAFTVVTVGGMMLSKPSHKHTKFPYYASLAILFTFGVTEFFTGIWISMSGLTYKRRLWIGGIVLFLSIWPLVGMHMGGLV